MSLVSAAIALYLLILCSVALYRGLLGVVMRRRVTKCKTLTVQTLASAQKVQYLSQFLNELGGGRSHE